MLHPALCCATCGGALGHLFMQFIELRDELVKEKTNGKYDKFIYTLKNNMDINLDEIFTKLGIPPFKNCCRGTLNYTRLMQDLGIASY